MPIMRTQTIVTAPIRTVPRDWIVRGYGEAHDRFRAASQQPHSPDELFIPLFEALNWAALLEEDQRPHTHQLLRAIRFGRNALVHDWADAVEGRDVPTPHIATGRGPRPPAVVWDWFWRDRQDFPKPKRTGKKPRKDQAGEAAYDAELSGKPVRDALDSLRQIF
jgi:hypothetical protein